jgi:uncharacterized protein YcfL
MKSAYLSLVLALALAGSACRSKPTHADQSTNAEAEIVQLDPRVTGAGSSRALEFTLQNTTDHDVTGAFTVEWYDKNGARVALSSTAWLGVELKAGSSRPVRVAPMPSEAVSWRLRFQSPER